MGGSDKNNWADHPEAEEIWSELDRAAWRRITPEWWVVYPTGERVLRRVLRFVPSKF